MRLEAPSCTLRSPIVGDVETIARHANNRKVWANLRDAFPHPYTLDDARAWIEMVNAEPRRLTFSIDVAGAAVGSITLRPGQDIERCSAELGYWLGETYWGRGIMTDAVHTICDYGFGSLGLVRIFAVPMACNAASFRVLEKCGFEREGGLRSACVKDGRVVDMVMYACTKHLSLRNEATLGPIDHVQLAIPVGGEQLARRFYVDALGLEEMAKPPELAKRGGAWFQGAGVAVHLGVDEDFHPATKAHPAFRCADYEALLGRLEARGVEIARDVNPFRGKNHCYITDPFRNRIELIEE